MNFEINKKIQQEYFFSYYSQKSRFQRLFNDDKSEIEICKYSDKFREIIENHLHSNGILHHGGELENLHNYCDEKNLKYDEYDINPIQKTLYSLTENNREIYYEFISKCLKKFFPFDFYFQKEITFRVHIPPKKGSSHKSPFPSFHMDSCLGHPPNEINIWIPLTRLDSKEFHAFNITSVNRSKDLLKKFNYDPYAIDTFRKSNGKELNSFLNHYQVKTQYGNALIFDARCMHSAMPVIHHTRFSIDIRIIPLDDFKVLPYKFVGSGRMKMPWIPGYGYDLLDSSKL